MLYNEKDLKEELELLQIDFEESLKQIRSGRANKDVFDNIKVTAYGADSTLNSVSNLVFEGPLNVVVRVWDKGLVGEVKKALDNANLGASVTDHGDHIRVNFYPLTEESRKEKVKELNRLLEDYRVRVRLVRQDYMQKVKGLDGVSEDEQKVDQEKIQEEIDSSIKELEEIAELKEKELLSL